MSTTTTNLKFQINLSDIKQLYALSEDHALALLCENCGGVFHDLAGRTGVLLMGARQQQQHAIGTDTGDAEQSIIGGCLICNTCHQSMKKAPGPAPDPEPDPAKTKHARIARLAEKYGLPMLSLTTLKPYEVWKANGLAVECGVCSRVPNCKMFLTDLHVTYCVDCFRKSPFLASSAKVVYNTRYRDAYHEAKSSNNREMNEWADYINQYFLFVQ